MVFLTISTGIGGGIVLGGRLLEGLAGEFGQLVDDDGARIEDRVAGRWMAEEAKAAGHDTDAAGVFAAAAEPWAERIIAVAAARVARLCRNVQLAVDPERDRHRWRHRAGAGLPRAGSQRARRRRSRGRAAAACRRRSGRGPG